MAEDYDVDRQGAAEAILRLAAEMIKAFDDYPIRQDKPDLLDKIGDELYPALENVDYMLKDGNNGYYYSSGLKFFD